MGEAPITHCSTWPWAELHLLIRSHPAQQKGAGQYILDVMISGAVLATAVNCTAIPNCLQMHLLTRS